MCCCPDEQGHETCERRDNSVMIIITKIAGRLNENAILTNHKTCSSIINSDSYGSNYGSIHSAAANLFYMPAQHLNLQQTTGPTCNIQASCTRLTSKSSPARLVLAASQPPPRRPPPAAHPLNSLRMMAAGQQRGVLQSRVRGHGQQRRSTSTFRAPGSS